MMFPITQFKERDLKGRGLDQILVFINSSSNKTTAFNLHSSCLPLIFQLSEVCISHLKRKVISVHESITVELNIITFNKNITYVREALIFYSRWTISSYSKTLGKNNFQIICIFRKDLYIRSWHQYNCWTKLKRQSAKVAVVTILRFSNVVIQTC